MKQSELIETKYEDFLKAICMLDKELIAQRGMPECDTYLVNRLHEGMTALLRASHYLETGGRD